MKPDAARQAIFRRRGSSQAHTSKTGSLAAPRFGIFASCSEARQRPRSPLASKERELQITLSGGVMVTPLSSRHFAHTTVILRGTRPAQAKNPVLLFATGSDSPLRPGPVYPGLDAGLLGGRLTFCSGRNQPPAFPRNRPILLRADHQHANARCGSRNVRV